MKRIDTSTRAIDLFGAGKDGYKDGNKAAGIPATDLNASVLNAVQEEIANVIEGAGAALNPADNTQLLQAINSLVKGPADKIVRVASTAAINLAAPGANIDGVVMVAGDTFLEKDHATLASRGVYVWNGAAVPATRDPSADAGAEFFGGMIIRVKEGTVNADTNWQITNDGTVTIGTTGLTFQQIGASQSTAAIQGAFKNLKIDALGVSNYNCIITADEVVLENSTNQYITQRAINKTINANGAVGAPLSIMSARTASTWYYRWLWYNATIGLTATLDTSSTAPTAPTGYVSTDYKALLKGACRTDASGSTYLLQIQTKNNRSKYIPLAGSNLTAPITAANGPATLWTAVGWSGLAPATAVSITVSTTLAAVSNKAAIAPNNAYTHVNAPFSCNNTSAGGSPSIFGDIYLESSNIYWENSGAAPLFIYGWEDNI